MTFDIPITQGRISQATRLFLGNVVIRQRRVETHADRVLFIQDVVRRIYELPPNAMTSRCREPYMAWPRQVAMALSRELTPLGTTAIGALFGGREHATVLHASTVVREQTEVDPKRRQEVEQIKQRLGVA